METYNGWNIFSMNDMTFGKRTMDALAKHMDANGIERPKPLGTVETDCIMGKRMMDSISGFIRANRQTKLEDGIAFTDKGVNVLGLTDARSITIPEDYTITGTISIDKPSSMTPFKCPCCGGNSYKTVNGKTVCEYCDTEFMR